MSRAITLTVALIFVTLGFFGLAVGAWASEPSIHFDPEAR